eukprot:CAMPEP_0194225398 /NCGR_PEP_ID=MMETSP0156-20130528/39524_1 /TAXON_ID=33649 /ORGANISM="Thalassionema nitzschioides, Strain L26-B" /LENGTH=224 /DNA_ID=CAMNT_0038957325 /DNA_START=22 /DNA_END=698 /DNA_ORIENTATION=+
MTGQRRRQICLFGTSADPPTGEGGHVGIVRALSKLAFDEVRVLPVYQHMFSNKAPTTSPIRNSHGHVPVGVSGIPKVTVSGDEKRCFELLAQKESSKVGTADLLDMLTAEEKDVDFSFAMGADTFMDLTQWKWRRSQDIWKLLEGRILTFIRPGLFENDDTFYRRAHDLNVKVVPVPELQPISSTQVRNSISKKELQDILIPSVLDYVVMHKLYGFIEKGEETI